MSRRGLVISFSGLDGAGKSTLIAWLRTELERRHRPVTVLPMSDGVGPHALLRAARDAMGRLVGHRRGDPPAPGPRWAGRARAAGLRGLPGRIRDAIVWSKPLRLVLYPVELFVFLAIRFYVATVRRRVLLTDRYFYDTLVDVADGHPWFWIRLLERLTPEPDVPVFLDVSPEESYARKGEYSVAYLARRRAAYRAIAPLVPSAVVLPNSDIRATRRALEQAVEKRLSS